MPAAGRRERRPCRRVLAATFKACRRDPDGAAAVTRVQPLHPDAARERGVVAPPATTHRCRCKTGRTHRPGRPPGGDQVVPNQRGRRHGPSARSDGVNGCSSGRSPAYARDKPLPPYKGDLRVFLVADATLRMGVVRCVGCGRCGRRKCAHVPSDSAIHRGWAPRGVCQDRQRTRRPLRVRRLCLTRHTGRAPLSPQDVPDRSRRDGAVCDKRASLTLPQARDGAATKLLLSRASLDGSRDNRATGRGVLCGPRAVGRGKVHGKRLTLIPWAEEPFA